MMTLRYGDSFEFDYDDYIHENSKEEDKFLICNLYFMDCINSTVKDVVKDSMPYDKTVWQSNRENVYYEASFDYDKLNVDCKYQRSPYDFISTISYAFNFS